MCRLKNDSSHSVNNSAKQVVSANWGMAPKPPISRRCHNSQINRLKNKMCHQIDDSCQRPQINSLKYIIPHIEYDNYYTVRTIPTKTIATTTVTIQKKDSIGSITPAPELTSLPSFHSYREAAHGTIRPLSTEGLTTAVTAPSTKERLTKPLHLFINFRLPATKTRKKPQFFFDWGAKQ